MKFKGKKLSDLEAVRYDGTKESMDAITDLGVKEVWRTNSHMFLSGIAYDGEKKVDINVGDYVGIDADGSMVVLSGDRISDFYEATETEAEAAEDLAKNKAKKEKKTGKKEDPSLTSISVATPEDEMVEKAHQKDVADMKEGFDQAQAKE